MAQDAITWIDGEWVAGNPPLLGPMTHAVWMASVVFDGARAMAGLAPDLDRHCARCIRSALAMGMLPPVTAGRIEELAWEGIARFAPDAELYIRPMMYTEDGFVAAVPESTRFVISVFESPMPATTGLKVCRSSYRRPQPDMATTDAKTASLYPNVGRALAEARGKGFDTAVMLDGLGNVAELATANLFMAKDGVASTPVLNGTFLDGITRFRVMELLAEDGLVVGERTITFAELMEADEIFATSNYMKILPVIRIEEREMQPGPVMGRARQLYFAFAEGAGRRK